MACAAGDGHGRASAYRVPRLAVEPLGGVLRRDGSVVEGLFATGNAVATTEFRNYVTGYANSRNFAMAYAAMNAIAAD